ncbi:MAG: 8-amino-7-oxononanoate synthase [Gammaproteobacteria bacterium]|nr:8-amino-7-oxononanoate synthase [Gammaproteobacteria bacterium]
MPPAAIAELAQRLAEADGAHALRRRRTRAGTALRPSLDGRQVVNFATNDYLGLAADPRVIDAYRQGVACYGAGAGAAELVSGHTDAHAELEAALARFTGQPRALVLSTGYMANLCVVTTLASRRTAVIEDRLNHASMLDAAILARARLQRYHHLDMVDLATRVAVSPGALVATDGVFSMDGDMAPLPRMVEICKGADSTLILDDAHGFGVLGARGGGSIEHFGLKPRDVAVVVGTFGKAFGGAGAFVAADDLVIEAMIQFARPYIYTTALPPALCRAMTTSLRIVEDEADSRRRLRANIDRFRRRALARGVPLTESCTPIQPVIVGENRRAVAVAERLLAGGYWVAAIRPPTVPAGSARLRVALSAGHAEEEVDGVVDVLAACL